MLGSLNDIISASTKDDVKIALKTSAENLYHSACHIFLYEDKTAETLVGLYKMTFFILQAIYFIDTSEYIKSRTPTLQACKPAVSELSNMTLGTFAHVPYRERASDNLY